MKFDERTRSFLFVRLNFSLKTRLIYLRLNLRKAGISTEFDGGKIGKMFNMKVGLSKGRGQGHLWGLQKSEQGGLQV